MRHVVRLRLSAASFVGDIRLALRSLRRTAGFFATGVGSLGLALGVCTLTFAALEAVAHPYVPYQDPTHLYTILDLGWGPKGAVSSAEKYVQLRDGTQFYTSIAYVAGSPAIVSGPAGPEDDWTAMTSANLSSMLGLRPALGRLPNARDHDQTGAVVSHHLWQRQFAGRHTLAGATITVDDRTYPVIGVLPEAISEPLSADVWLPGPPTPPRNGAYWVRSVVRLKPGVPPTQVRAELAVVAARLTNIYGAGQVPFSFRLQSLTPTPAPLRATHEAMVAAAIAVLLLACANLGSLMLARGLSRRQELAVRLALGASHATLARLLTAESIVMSVFGAILGAALAIIGLHLLEYRMPPAVASIGILVPRLDWRVFGLVFAATALTIALAGLIPAWRTTGMTVAGPLKEHGGAVTRRAHRYNPIVIGEIAMTIALLLGAGLLVKAARRVSSYEFGFDSDRLLAAYVRLAPADSTDATAGRAVDGLVDRLRRVDDVQSAAAIAFTSPLAHVVRSASTGEAGQRLFLRSYATVDPDFLRTLGIPVIAGRDFEPGDATGPGVVIVDAEVARRLWPHGGAVGGQISFGDERSQWTWLPVVGIARSASFEFNEDPDLSREPMIYAVVPHNHSRYRIVAVRARTTVASSIGAHVALDVRRALLTSGEQGFVQPWRAEFDEVVRARRFVADLFVAFGALALFLSAFGLFGVLAYTVGQRKREFGIRMAVGARGFDVFRLVLHDGAVMVLGGTALGAFFAMWTAKLLAAWLYGVDPTDATALVSAELVLLVASLTACVMPALRAARTDPLDILRAT